MLEKLGPHQIVVSFSPYVNDSGAYADLVLPDHHSLETTAAVLPAVSPGPAWMLATPFVQPLFESRATEQVLVELGKKLNAAFEPATPRAMLEKTLPAGQSWEETTRLGGLWGQPGPAPPPRPAPGALEVAPAVFSGSETEFPLHLQPYFTVQFYDGRGANHPWMQELPDPASSAMWGLPVEVDPQTAAKLGIRTGDLVRVISPHGEMEAPAFVHPAAAPGVVSMGIGQGHGHYGRYASNRGANPLSILGLVWEPVTGALAYGATRVRLMRLPGRGNLIQFSPQDREQGPWGRR